MTRETAVGRCRARRCGVATVPTLRPRAEHCRKPATRLMPSEGSRPCGRLRVAVILADSSGRGGTVGAGEMPEGLCGHVWVFFPYRKRDGICVSIFGSCLAPRQQEKSSSPRWKSHTSQDVPPRPVVLGHTTHIPCCLPLFASRLLTPG